MDGPEVGGARLDMGSCECLRFHQGGAGRSPMQRGVRGGNLEEKNVKGVAVRPDASVLGAVACHDVVESPPTRVQADTQAI